jgi:hypothetical protein
MIGSVVDVASNGLVAPGVPVWLQAETKDASKPMAPNASSGDLARLRGFPRRICALSQRVAASP